MVPLQTSTEEKLLRVLEQRRRQGAPANEGDFVQTVSMRVQKGSGLDVESSLVATVPASTGAASGSVLVVSPAPCRRSGGDTEVLLLQVTNLESSVISREGRSVDERMMQQQVRVRFRKRSLTM